MTDKEKLIKLFEEFGIGYVLSSECYSPEDGETKNGVVLENPDYEPDHDKIVGYCGFYARFNFDEADNFINVGIWE